MMKKILIVCFILAAFHFAAYAQEAQKVAPLKPVYVKGKWGYADLRGRLVIKARFDAASPFVDGLAQVAVLDEELPEIERQPNLKWGYIDESGRVRVELRYAFLRQFSEGLAAAAVLDAEKPEKLLVARGLARLKWGYVDQSGREVIPVQFLAAGDFSEGLSQVNVGKASKSVCATPGNYGYIDKTGAFVIQPRFAVASAFQNGRARVSIGQTQYQGRCLCCAPRFFGKHGYIDRSGTFIADEKQPDDTELRGWEN